MQQSYRLCSSMCARAQGSEKSSQGCASILNKAPSRGNDKNSQGRSATLADPKRASFQPLQGTFRAVELSLLFAQDKETRRQFPKISCTSPS